MLQVPIVYELNIHQNQKFEFLKNFYPKFIFYGRRLIWLQKFSCLEVEQGWPCLVQPSLAAT